MKTASSDIFMLAKVYRTMTSGTVFQEIQPGVGFKTGDFFTRNVGGGGATVERLFCAVTRRHAREWTPLFLCCGFKFAMCL